MKKTTYDKIKKHAEILANKAKNKAFSPPTNIKEKLETTFDRIVRETEEMSNRLHEERWRKCIEWLEEPSKKSPA